MTFTTQQYFLALRHINGVGPAWLKKFSEKFSLDTLFNLSLNELESYGVTRQIALQLRNPPWEAVEQDLQWLASDPLHHCITFQDRLYPPLLTHIPSAPLLLYVKGQPEQLHHSQLAIVGSRTPSASGRSTALAFAKYLAEQGLTITSGLALGIDVAAHEGALAAQGKTIAVLGNGLSKIYPRQHEKLAIKILEQGGALVSEFTPNDLPRPEYFPRRNRIISGLSVGTLIVEAAIQSGSLITAQHALEQGREVFAIPGSIHNPLAKGCHQLIKQGAKLVETAEDILEELSVCITSKKENLSVQEESALRREPLSPDYAHLLKQIDFSPTPVDILVQRSALPVQQVASMLLLLEMQGYIQQEPQGYIKSL